MEFSEIFDKLGFDWRLALINAINFLLFFIILQRFVLSKVATAIANRQKKLDESLKNADQLAKELSEAQEKSDAIIKDANRKANEIIITHQQEAELLASQIKKEAEGEATALKQKAKEDIKKEKETMRKELLDETAELSVKAAQKLLEEEISVEKDKKLVKKYIEQIESQITS